MLNKFKGVRLSDYFYEELRAIDDKCDAILDPFYKEDQESILYLPESARAPKIRDAGLSTQARPAEDQYLMRILYHTGAFFNQFIHLISPSSDLTRTITQTRTRESGIHLSIGLDYFL